MIDYWITEEAFLTALMQGCTQQVAAQYYAGMICRQNTVNWPRINTAIRERWSGMSSLERVKKKAWQHIEEQRKELEHKKIAEYEKELSDGSD